MSETRHTVDTITPEALKQLYAEIDRMKLLVAASSEPGHAVRMAAQYAERAIENGQRAEQAEAERDKACRAFNAKVMELEKAKEERATFALIFEGFGRLLATSSRDWGAYRVDAWLWAVILGWDCEETVHDDTCVHGAMDEMAKSFGWDEATVAKARRYRAAVRALEAPEADR